MKSPGIVTARNGPITERVAHVYCGNFVGPPHWHGLEFYEPDECNFEGDVPLPESPKEDGMAVWTCPGCHAVNTVRDHS